MDASQEQQSPFMTPVQPDNAPLKHSGPGIASFILGLLSILSAIVGFLMITVWVSQFMGSDGTIFMPDPNEIELDPSMVGGVLLFFLSMLLSVVGVILGIVGCVIRNRRRVFAILGLVFSSLIFLFIIVTFALGLAMQ